jgi:hypothetical protein
VSDTDIVTRLQAFLEPQRIDESQRDPTALITAAIAEIKRLREYEWMYKDLCK